MYADTDADKLHGGLGRGGKAGSMSNSGLRREVQDSLGELERLIEQQHRQVGVNHLHQAEGKGPCMQQCMHPLLNLRACFEGIMGSSFGLVYCKMAFVFCVLTREVYHYATAGWCSNCKHAFLAHLQSAQVAVYSCVPHGPLFGLNIEDRTDQVSYGSPLTFGRVALTNRSRGCPHESAAA